MPKIIKNLQNRLIEETKRQILEFGYSAVTIRSVATACGIAVGTVYNYFHSKEELIATYMSSDWKLCIDTIHESSRQAEAPEDVVRCIYDQLLLFSDQHRSVIEDKEAISSFHVSYTKYHAILRAQLAEPLKKFCHHDFAPEFIAESILTWTFSNKEFQDIWSMVKNCF